MLSTADRRKAASLFIVLIVFLFCVKIDLAMDLTSEDENYNPKMSTSQNFIFEESAFYKTLSLGVSENAQQKSELEDMLLCYNIPVKNDSDKVAEEFFINMNFVVNEAAEAEEEERVAENPKEVKKNNDLRSNTKVTSKKIVSDDTASKNTVSENSVEPVNTSDRGEIFVYKTSVTHTEEDELFLARIIHGEAGNQEIMEKYRVGNATLNRFKDKTGRFPQDTMKGIAYANGQFGCTRGNAWLHPTDEEMQIAKDLFDGKCVFLDDDVVYFNDTWIDGYFYCKPGYHCFASFLDHNEDCAELLASAKQYRYREKPKKEAQVVQEDVVDNSETNESQTDTNSEEINENNEESAIIEDNSFEQDLPEVSEKNDA